MLRELRAAQLCCANLCIQVVNLDRAAVAALLPL